MEQCLKKTCQKNKISKILLKKKIGLIILEIKERLYISRSLRHWMVRRYYDNPTQRHPRISKTVELLSQNYYFPGMRKEVERYVSKCQNCQLNKHTMHVLYRYIQYIKIADYLWQNIIMDFIVKLSKSEDVSTEMKYNSILVIINKFTKYIYLIFCNEEFTTKQTACVVLDRVVRHHSILESITSDRDKIFISTL